MSIGRFGPTGLTYGGGRPAANLSVTVVERDTTTEAVLYSDLAGTEPLGNPLSADAYGNLSFYTEAGDYDLLANGGRLQVTVDPPATGGGGGGGGISSLILVKNDGTNTRNDYGVTYVVDDFHDAPTVFDVIPPNAPVAEGVTLGVERYGDVFDLSITPGHVRPTLPGLYDVGINIVIAGASADANEGSVTFKATPPTSGALAYHGSGAGVQADDPTAFDVVVNMIDDSKNPTGPPVTSSKSRWYHGVPFSADPADDTEWLDVIFYGAVSNAGTYDGWGSTVTLEVTFNPILVDLS